MFLNVVFCLKEVFMELLAVNTIFTVNGCAVNDVKTVNEIFLRAVNDFSNPLTAGAVNGFWKFSVNAVNKINIVN